MHNYAPSSLLSFRPRPRPWSGPVLKYTTEREFILLSGVDITKSTKEFFEQYIEILSEL